jgi:hypothetical protein
MTDPHLAILRAIARSRARRLAADSHPRGAAEEPPTERRLDLERRSVLARRRLSSAQARRHSPRDAS